VADLVIIPNLTELAFPFFPGPTMPTLTSSPNLDSNVTLKFSCQMIFMNFPKFGKNELGIAKVMLCQRNNS
jgi:hypothetical protein